MFEWEGVAYCGCIAPNHLHDRSAPGSAARHRGDLRRASARAVRPDSVDGRDGVILEKLDGPDSSASSGGKPWRVPPSRELRASASSHQRLRRPFRNRVLHDRFRRIISHDNRSPPTSSPQRFSTSIVCRKATDCCMATFIRET